MGENPSKAKHNLNCGHAKLEWFNDTLLISPLEENCESQFKFTALGKIEPVDANPQAQYTIDILNLDNTKLNAARCAAMWADGDMEGKLSEEEKRDKIEKLLNSETCKYEPFLDAILYQLRK